MKFDGVSEPWSGYAVEVDYEHELHDVEHEHEEDEEPKPGRASKDGLAVRSAFCGFDSLKVLARLKIHLADRLADF